MANTRQKNPFPINASPTDILCRMNEIECAQASRDSVCPMSVYPSKMIHMTGEIMFASTKKSE